MTDDNEAAPPVRIEMTRLSPSALDGLIEEFVTRDGTDYGAEEHSLAQKKSAVRRQLERGEVIIVFDPATESCNLIAADSDLARRLGELP